MPLVWEEIDPWHKRLSVPGGWVLKTFEDVIHDKSDGGRGMVSGWDWRVAMCFIPDPEHEWKIKDIEDDVEK